MEEPKPAQSAPAQPSPAPVVQSQAPVQAPPSQPSAPGLTPEMEVAANDLVMLTGKSKDQCILALRASQGNPDVAYEILASGMPLDGSGVGGGQ